MECFTESNHKFKLSRVPGPLSPILFNPQFPPGMEHHPLSNKQPDIGLRKHHILQEGKLISRDHMNTLWAEPNLSLLEYWQLKRYVNSLQNKADLSEALTDFENLWMSHTPQRHVISRIHNMLWDNIQADEGIACKAWAKDLDIELTSKSWDKIYRSVHKGSINVSIQETNYKIISRWYRTPSILHRFDASYPDKCWRCQRETGDLLHIWWSCPIIQAYWKQVHKLIEKITTYVLDYTPAQFLLHLPKPKVTSYFKSLAMMLVNAAKMCVPTLWGTPRAPSISEWYKRINKIAEMEELIAISRNSPHKFSTLWACWIHFKSSEEYLQKMRIQTPHPLLSPPPY